jgi:hypothetical protein
MVAITGQFHCPPEGIYAYEHPKACEQYYLCTNGTLTHEFCPNGLAHAIDGAVYGFCAHQWKVDCKDRLLRMFHSFIQIMHNFYITSCDYGFKLI